MNSISFGNPDETWAKHNITQYPVDYNDEKSNWKAIVRNDKLVAILSKYYVLLPNEEAFNVAMTAAQMAGLQPFTPARFGMFAPKDNRLYNKAETRMHALFMPKDEHTVGGEKLKIGVDVFNAIDGSSSFGASIFTYRAICGNGVIYGKQEIFGVTQIHTKGLQPVIDNLKNVILSVMDHTNDVLEGYKRLAEERLTEKMVERLRKKFPKTVQPEWLKVEEKQAQFVALKDISLWEAYNDLTQLIWHNKSDITTKNQQYNALHKIIPLVVRQ
jgi:hypothetical protein